MYNRLVMEIIVMEIRASRIFKKINILRCLIVCDDM